MHLDLDDAIALAGLAAAALDVERKASRLIAARFRFRQTREPFADRREGAGIGRRIGARRAPDRRLIDVDDLVEMLQALDRLMRRRMLDRAVELARHGLVKRIDDQRRLAAAGDAGDAGEEAERNIDAHVLQIIAGRVDDLELARRVRLAPCARHRHLQTSGQILPGQRLRIFHDLGRRALRDDLAAMNAGARPDIDDMVGSQDRVLVMLDDDDAVAEIAQPPQGFEQLGIVALMQADRRLVEHIEHAGETGADLRGEPDALALAARERARRAG